MENDEYVVIISGNKSKHYYKNGLLHREVGPAIVTSYNKETYSGLSDEHLYKEVLVQSFTPSGYKPIYVTEEIEDSPRMPYRKAIYYLDGNAYAKRDFDKRITQMNLKNDLNTELLVNQSNTKKPKI